MWQSWTNEFLYGNNTMWLLKIWDQLSESVKVAQSCMTLCDPMDFQAKNTRMGSHSLLHGIFPTQGSNPGLPHCKWILYQLSHQGSPHFTYKWPDTWDQGLRLSSNSFLCLSKRGKGKGTFSYRGGCHQSEPRHSGCKATWKHDITLGWIYNFL